MNESDFWEQFFSGRQCRKLPFLQILFGFFLHISLSFSYKNIINNNTHHQACSIVKKNLFLKSELSKNRRHSQFSPEKRYFLNISSSTWYFFMEFFTLTQNGSVQKCDGVRLSKNKIFPGQKRLEIIGFFPFLCFFFT